MQKLHLFIIPLFALLILASCSKPPSTSPDTTGAVSSKSPAQIAFDGKILKGDHRVILHTSKGDITLKLDADAAPKTVTNFIALAHTGFYEGLTFHRVIPDFMIQGGDPQGDGTGGTSVFGDNFEDEINARSYNLHKKKLQEIAQGQPLPPELENLTVEEYLKLQGYIYDDSLESLSMERGAIAMANRGPNTNASQFFIIVRTEGTSWLEGKHTVFGEVTEGMDVIDAIANVPRDGTDKPLEEVTFTIEVVK